MLATIFAAVLAAAPVDFQPTEAWRVERQGNNYIASRNFAAADAHALKVHFNSDLVGEGLTILVDGPRAGRPVGYDDASGVILADGERFKPFMLATDEYPGDRFITQIETSFSTNLAPEKEMSERERERSLRKMMRMSEKQRDQYRFEIVEEQQLREIIPGKLTGNHLDIQYSDDLIHRYHIGDIDELRSVLDTCEKAVLADLGIEQPAALPFYPPRLFDDGVEYKELPSQVQKGQTMRLQALVRVDAEGGVEECHLILPTGFADFDEKFCSKMIEDGRYVPARDSERTSVPSLFHQRLTLTIRRRAVTSTSPL
ncbi:hypothetical protein WJS89_08955 [Sphingomicrobium sp. XHP0235]|uniref:hypothetical protein n=1 Tax=Sphingomicrobium aquimarinum TaxID=3133971 RepID=UPI0031FE6373